MAFPSIQITQSGDCSKFTIVDNSEYGAPNPDKSTFIDRRIIITKSDGTRINQTGGATTGFITFPIGGTNPDSIEISGLSEDFSFNVTMELEDLSTTIDVTQTVSLTCYTMSCFFVRTQKMGQTPKLQGNSEFVRDTFRLLIEKESAVKAASEGDIFSAQEALSRAKFICDNDFIL